jgi:hypothetical protein
MIRQEICISGDYYDIPIRNDGLLGTPILLYPREGANVCFEATPGNTAQIYLSWQSVVGATQYIVEWCDNVSFTGSSLRAAITASTLYVLDRDVNIRVGETLYWRVFARNGTGSLSDKSRPRSIAFKCPEGVKDPTRKENFDANVIVHGDDYMKCCETKMWSNEISFICQDQLERSVASIESVEWSVSALGGDDDPEIVSFTDDYVIIKACGLGPETSQIFEITLTVTFNDFIRGDTFEVTGKKKVFLDCHTTLQENSPFSNCTENYPLLSVPEYFYDEYPLTYDFYTNFERPSVPYEVMTVAGYVYKVPFIGRGCPPTYIEFGDCCDCMPPSIDFRIESEVGISSGTLTYNEETGCFTFSGVRPVTSQPNGGGNAQLEAQLCCVDGVFEFAASETITCACGGKYIETAELQYIRSQYCDMIYSGPVVVPIDSTDSCLIYWFFTVGSTQYRVIADLNTDLLEVYKLDGDTYVFLQDKALGECVEGTSITNAFCIDPNGGTTDCICLVLTLECCEIGAENVSFIEHQFEFPDCANPSGEIEDAWDTGVAAAVIFSPATDAYGCYCDDYACQGLYIESYALEARVNIPIGCGLVFRNGVLSLDLSAIAGDGLTASLGEDGCYYLSCDCAGGYDPYDCCYYDCCPYDDLVVCTNGVTEDVTPTPGQSFIPMSIYGGDGVDRNKLIRFRNDEFIVFEVENPFVHKGEPVFSHDENILKVGTGAFFDDTPVVNEPFIVQTAITNSFLFMGG